MDQSKEIESATVTSVESLKQFLNEPETIKMFKEKIKSILPNEIWKLADWFYVIKGEDLIFDVVFENNGKVESVYECRLPAQ